MGPLWRALDTVTINVGGDNGHSIEDALKTMLSSAGITATATEVSAYLMKLDTKGFKMIGTKVGILGAVGALDDFIENPTLLNGAQLALGVTLIVTGAQGYILLAGGTVLFLSELIEIYQDNY